jgi:hypothetical protein
MKKDKDREEIIKVLSALPKVSYKLTKIKNTRAYGMVYEGDTVSGSLKLVEVLGEPAIFVDNSARDHFKFDAPKYIRTSPIVAILDNSETSVTFQTEGGVYKLEQLKESKK